MATQVGWPRQALVLQGGIPFACLAVDPQQSIPPLFGSVVSDLFVPAPMHKLSCRVNVQLSAVAQSHRRAAQGLQRRDVGRGRVQTDSWALTRHWSTRVMCVVQAGRAIEVFAAHPSAVYSRESAQFLKALGAAPCAAWRGRVQTGIWHLAFGIGPLTWVWFSASREVVLFQSSMTFLKCSAYCRHQKYVKIKGFPGCWRHALPSRPLLSDFS